MKRHYRRFRQVDEKIFRRIFKNLIFTVKKNYSVCKIDR